VDYRQALEELDNEFPGVSYDESLLARMEELGRLKEIKIFILKRGIYLLIGLGLLVTVIKLIPAAIIIICLVFVGKMKW
jgi:hypothetical protein